MNATFTDKHLAQLRIAGLVRPRPPYPGQEWKPRTPAEGHLLRECHRLDRLRLLLLEEVGRLRGQNSRAEVLADAARKADRLSKCPLTPAQFTAVAAAAAGESLEETALRLCLSYETVRTSRRRALARLGVADMARAVALALANGWLLPGDVLADGGEVR